MILDEYIMIVYHDDEAMKAMICGLLWTYVEFIITLGCLSGEGVVRRVVPHIWDMAGA